MSGPWEAYGQKAATAEIPADGPWTAYEDKKDESTWDKVKHYGKLTGSALARGAAALPALGADIAKMTTSSTLDPWEIVAGSKRKVDPNVKFDTAISDFVEKQGTQPTGSGEKLFNAAVEGASGGLVGVGRKALAKGLTIGAGAGGSAEIGKRVLPPEVAGPIGPLLFGAAGGIGAGTLAGAVSRIRPQTAAVASQAIEGVTDAELRQAALFQSLAKQKGVDLDLSQALGYTSKQGGGLSTIRDTVANSRFGDNTQQMLANQPGQVGLLADKTIKGLPGPNWSAQQAANAGAEAATGAIDVAKKQRTAAVQPYYETAGNLSQDSREAILQAIRERMARPEATDGVKVAGAKLAGKISGKDGGAEQLVNSKREAVREATTNLQRVKARAELQEAIAAAEQAAQKPLPALTANTALSDSIGPWKGSPLSPVDPLTSGQVKGLGREVNSLLKESSSSIRQGEELYQRLSREVVDPLKQGPVGQMAGRGGYSDAVQTPVGRMNELFSKGSSANVAEEARNINAFAREVKAVDKNAFPAMAKAWTRERLDNALSAELGAATDGNTAAAVQKALFGSRSQMQGMRDIAAKVADSYDITGDDKAALVRGVEHLAQITKAAANRPANVSSISSQEVQQLGKTSLAASGLRSFGFTPFERSARVLEEMTKGKTYRTFDDLLTSPEGAETLIRLGRTPIMSNTAATALGTFAGVVAAGSGGK